MNEILWPFFIGLAGSLHCLGMCGPLVVAYSLEAAQGVRASAAGAGSIGTTLACHLAFHSGRVITYGVMGALAGGFFEAADLGRFSHHFRTYLWAGGGVLLVFFGLAMLKVLPFPRILAAGFGNPDSFLIRRIRTLTRSPGITSKIGLGMAAGLLPCCLSWAMVITAASSQSMVGGYSIMVGFGLGTVPTLLLTGFSASFISLKTRLLGERAAALAVVAMGVVLVLKATGVIA